MFILVYFGYRQYRIFAIDCLTASLMDNIWNFCHKDMIKLLTSREDLHNKELINLQKKIIHHEKRIQDIEKALVNPEEAKKLEEVKSQTVQYIIFIL